MAEQKEAEEKKLESPDKKIEERKEKIKNWLKNSDNLLLIALLVFAFVVLIYYFNITKNQPLWYDEAEYMSAANKWAFGIPYDIHKARPPLIAFLASLIFRLGLGLLSAKFILELIPLFLSVLFIYLFVNEIYGNKKLALITSFILSVSWIHLFYSMRMMTDALCFMFGILALLCLWKGYVNNKGNKYIWFIGPLVALAFLCRLTGILYGGFIVVFLLFTDKFKFLKNKHIWISLFITVLPIIPFLFWSYSYYGNPLAFFRAGYSGIPSIPLGWGMLQLVYDYPEFLFFICFLIGALTLFPMLLSLDLIIFKKDKKFLPDFFVFLLLVFTIAFFIYFLRLAENRWLMMMSISIFILSAKGIVFVSEFIKKYFGKFLAVTAIVLLLVGGAYYELKHADGIIKMKKDSYSQVRDAAIWMKENSNPDDIIVSASHPQNTYYSERKTITSTDFFTGHYYTQEELDARIKKIKPKYYVVSAFEPSVPQWTYTYPQNNSMFKPVKIWFADAEQKQPILIVYEISYNNP